MVVAVQVFSLGLLLLGSLFSAAAGQCPAGTRLTPTRIPAGIGERVAFRCFDASSDANVNGARFFKDGALITSDGSKYSNSLAYVLNIASIDLADEGEYTCRPQSSCGNSTAIGKGFLLGESKNCIYSYVGGL